MIPTPPLDIDGIVLSEDERELWELEFVALYGARESPPEVYASDYIRRNRELCAMTPRKRVAKIWQARLTLPMPPEAPAVYARVLAIAAQKWSVQPDEIALYENTKARHWCWSVLSRMFNGTLAAKIADSRKTTVGIAVCRMRKDQPELTAEADRVARELLAEFGLRSREERAA